MSLVIIKLLILGSIILNLIIILGTRKFKEDKNNINSSIIYKRELFILLRKLWIKEIILVSIGVTLLFISIFIKESINEIAVNTLKILCNFYIFISVLLGSYNYNKFNRDVANLINNINN
ncbi:hypothetical protein [Clostridium nigeriense]|uniref:hypothetical protein n=1 Tax=Clostridium nigeriense TaxID=1805470 RepID=UPI00082B53C6|nr:hypothetical protein [Clostridium nigeriense]